MGKNWIWKWPLRKVNCTVRFGRAVTNLEAGWMLPNTKIMYLHYSS